MRSCFVQQDDDDVKTSEPVAEEAGKFIRLENNSIRFLIYLDALAKQISWTTSKILGSKENQTLSPPIPVHQQTPTISIITETNTTIESGDVRPCLSPTTRMIRI